MGHKLVILAVNLAAFLSTTAAEDGQIGEVMGGGRIGERGNMGGDRNSTVRGVVSEGGRGSKGVNAECQAKLTELCGCSRESEDGRACLEQCKAAHGAELSAVCGEAGADRVTSVRGGEVRDSKAGSANCEAALARLCGACIEERDKVCVDQCVAEHRSHLDTLCSTSVGASDEHGSAAQMARFGADTDLQFTAEIDLSDLSTQAPLRPESRSLVAAAGQTVALRVPVDEARAASSAAGQHVLTVSSLLLVAAVSAWSSC